MGQAQYSAGLRRHTRPCGNRRNLARDNREIENQGNLALWTTAAVGYMKIVEFLLQHSANPNKTGPPTALYVAVRKENREIVKLLKAYGARR